MKNKKAHKDKIFYQSLYLVIMLVWLDKNQLTTNELLIAQEEEILEIEYLSPIVDQSHDIVQWKKQGASWKYYKVFVGP